MGKGNNNNFIKTPFLPRAHSTLQLFTAFTVIETDQNIKFRLKVMTTFFQTLDAKTTQVNQKLASVLVLRLIVHRLAVV